MFQHYVVGELYFDAQLSLFLEHLGEPGFSSNFFAVGPFGVGKTTALKAVGQGLTYGNSDNFIVVQGDEFVCDDDGMNELRFVLQRISASPQKDLVVLVDDAVRILEMCKEQSDEKGAKAKSVLVKIAKTRAVVFLTTNLGFCSLDYDGDYDKRFCANDDSLSRAVASGASREKLHQMARTLQKDYLNMKDPSVFGQVVLVLGGSHLGESDFTRFSQDIVLALLRQVHCSDNEINIVLSSDFPYNWKWSFLKQRRVNTGRGLVEHFRKIVEDAIGAGFPMETDHIEDSSSCYESPLNAHSLQLTLIDGESLDLRTRTVLGCDILDGIRRHESPDCRFVGERTIFRDLANFKALSCCELNRMEPVGELVKELLTQHTERNCRGFFHQIWNSNSVVFAVENKTRVVGKRKRSFLFNDNDNDPIMHVEGNQLLLNYTCPLPAGDPLLLLSPSVKEIRDAFMTQARYWKWELKKNAVSTEHEEL